MEINYQNIRNDCMQWVAKGQTVVRTEIDLKDRGGATKLLTVNVGATVTSVETVEGKAQAAGKVTYKILYLDGEGKTCGLDYFADFDMDVEDEAIAVGEASATAGVLDADYTLSADRIQLEAVCEINVLAVVSHEADAVAAVEGECLEEEISTVTLTAIPDSTFELVEEVEVGTGVDRVLYFDAKALHTATRMGVDSTTVEGKVAAVVVYKTQGEVREKEIAFDFAEQLDVEGEVDITLATKQAKLVLTGEDDDNVLRIEMVLAARGYRVNRNDYVLVADAYVADCDLVVRRDSFVCRRFAGQLSRTERISAKVGDDLPVSASVIAATASTVNVANLIAGDGQITVEGLAVASVLYRTEEGAYDATEVEMPFSTAFASEGVSEDCLLSGEAIAPDVSAVGGTVEMTLLFSVKCYRPTLVRYTTAIEATERTNTDAVMSVYFAAPDESVWDVARAVHVAPSELLRQNPALAEPQEDGQLRRVVVFRHRDLD